MLRIFDKTDKGREEIATRKFRLAPRLRTLLLLIDGKQSIDHLLQKIAGLDEQSIEELHDSGFIQLVDASATAIPEPGTAHIEKTETLAEAALAAPVAAKIAADTIQGMSLHNPLVPHATHAEPTPFQALHHFYSDSIRTMIGLRGYALQLKVDQAASSADFLALREQYVTAVQKAKGDEIAKNCCAQLDQLLAAADALAAE